MSDCALEITKLDLLASGRAPQRRSALMEAQSDVIMRKIGFMLFQKMRCNVRLLSCINGVISHEAALGSMPDVMLAGIADIAPLHGRVIVAVEGDLIGAVVDGMCGASSGDMFYRTELSAMETRIAKQMIEMTYTAITEVFANLMPLRWTIVQFETSTSMLTIAAEQDWMISTTGIFETPIGIGSIRFIAPYAGFEPLENKVSSQLGIAGSSAADRRWMATLESLTSKLPFEVFFEIVRAEIPLRLFKQLNCGDILPCAVLPEAFAVSSGIDLFVADYGQHEGRICCAARMPRTETAPPALSTLSSSIVLPVQATAGASQSRHRAATSLWEQQTDRVTVKLTVELGRLHLSFQQFANLRYGELLVLEQAVGEPLRVFANGCLLGMGEVVVGGHQQCGIKLLSLV